MTHVSLLAAQSRARPCPRDVASRKAVFTQVPGVGGAGLSLTDGGSL